MNRNRAKVAFLRSAPFTAGLFILSIVLFAVGSIIDGNLISPFHILFIFGMFVLIGVINFFRAYIDNSKWAMSKPSVVKNFIFAPIYLVIALVTVIVFTGGTDIVLLLVMGLVFLIVFMVMQTIVYFAAKKKTDKINDALEIFLKEHESNEQE